MGLLFYSEVVSKPQQLGVIIRARREEISMSQPTLAVLAGTTPEAIWAIEVGKRQPRWPTLARIAAVLELPLSELDPAVDYEVAAARNKAPKSPQEEKALRDQRERMRKRHP